MLRTRLCVKLRVKYVTHTNIRKVTGKYVTHTNMRKVTGEGCKVSSYV